MQEIQLSNVQVEPGEGGLIALQIEVSPQSVLEARQSVLKKYSRKMKVPGFRPGHVPLNIVARNLGDQSLAQEISDELVPPAYQQALRQTEIEPLAAAEVDDVSLEEFDGSRPMHFTAR